MVRPIRIAIAGTVVLMLAGCAKSEPAKDTTTAMAPAEPAPAPAPAKTISLADLAGRWNFETRGDGTDTMVTKAVVVATADSTGWVMELPTGKKVAQHVTVSGDSIMVKSDTYASMRRKGKQVWSEGVYRLENGKLVGTLIGHYANSGADSVLKLHSVGTKQ
jgi:glucose/arabinose dehydrogenase